MFLTHRKLRHDFVPQEPVQPAPRKAPIQLPTEEPEFDQPTLASQEQNKPRYIRSIKSLTKFIVFYSMYINLKVNFSLHALKYWC